MLIIAYEVRILLLLSLKVLQKQKHPAFLSLSKENITYHLYQVKTLLKDHFHLKVMFNELLRGVEVEVF